MLSDPSTYVFTIIETNRALNDGRWVLQRFHKMENMEAKGSILPTSFCSAIYFFPLPSICIRSVQQIYSLLMGTALLN